MTDRDPLYCRHRFPAEVIARAVWLYFRFPLSLRMVEDLLAARGIIVSHQTVRLWAEKFGRCLPTRAVIDYPVGLETSGISMKPLFQSAARSIGCGAQLIRTVSSWRFSYKAAEMQRPPSA